MFIKQYVNHWITNVLAVAFFTLALLSFGYAEYFDRLFIVYLIAVAAVYIKNVNVVSIIAILMVERLIEELVFFTNTFDIAKLGLYTLSLILLRYFWYDKLVKRLVCPFLVVIFAIEIYWYIIDYPPPRIHFYLAMVWLNIITRHLLFMRVPICSQLKLKNVSQTTLDWQLYSLTMLNVVVIKMMLVEYLIRHLTPAKPILVYEYYPYAMQLLSVVTLFLITNFVIKLKFQIKA